MGQRAQFFARPDDGDRQSRQRKKPLRIRAKDFRAWFNANLRGYANDIASHGADGGFPCITYTCDAVCIFDRFEDEIWEMAVQDAGELGFKNACDMIASFTRADMIEQIDSFKNLMVWYACERTARELIKE
jgi:hypothetical protein